MIAKGTGFVKGDKASAEARLVAHLKYIEYRQREENESRNDRHIFTSDQDRVSRSTAVEDVMDHAHSQVAYHKIVLSPGKDEYVSDWQTWTREVMNDLEKKQGRKLHWYAVKHDNTDNPHVHVILAGAGSNNETGKREAVKLYRQDYELLRQSGTDRSDHEWYRHIEEHLREEDRQEGMEHSHEPEHYQGGDHDR